LIVVCQRVKVLYKDEAGVTIKDGAITNVTAPQQMITSALRLYNTRRVFFKMACISFLIQSNTVVTCSKNCTIILYIHVINMKPTILHSPQQHEAQPAREFRSIDVELAGDPVYDSRLWLLAGLILATAILLSIAFAYVESRKQFAPRQMHNALQ
jgi:hypothetical protein